MNDTTLTISLGMEHEMVTTLAKEMGWTEAHTLTSNEFICDYIENTMVKNFITKTLEAKLIKERETAVASYVAIENESIQETIETEIGKIYPEGQGGEFATE